MARANRIMQGAVALEAEAERGIGSVIPADDIASIIDIGGRNIGRIGNRDGLQHSAHDCEAALAVIGKNISADDVARIIDSYDPGIVGAGIIVDGVSVAVKEKNCGWL